MFTTSCRAPAGLGNDRGSPRSSSRASFDRAAGERLCVARPAGAGGPFPPPDAAAGDFAAGVRTSDRASREGPTMPVWP